MSTNDSPGVKREPDKTLFIGGLDDSVPESEIRKIFEKFGKITDWKVLIGKKCGFIQYEKTDSAETAIREMNGKSIGRFPIRVSWRNQHIPPPPNKMKKKGSYNDDYDRGYDRGYDAPYYDKPYDKPPIYDKPVYGGYDYQAPQPYDSYSHGGYPPYESPYSIHSTERNPPYVKPYESDFIPVPTNYYPPYSSYEMEPLDPYPMKRPYGNEVTSPSLKKPKMEGDRGDRITMQKTLLDAEKKLMEQYRLVNTLRTTLPWQKISEYTFSEYKEKKSVPVKMGELFLEGDSLIVFHLDYTTCGNCVMFLDGLNGVIKYIAEKTNFVVCSKASILEMETLASDRKWSFRMISSEKTSFNLDYHAEINDKQYPAFSVFKKKTNLLYHTLTTDLSLTTKDHTNMDLFGSVWTILDLLPEGREHWKPNGSK